MNDILNKKFKHHKWFLEGLTCAYALNYFAKSGDFGLGKNILKQLEKTEERKRNTNKEEN